jgi:uncharacterized protein with ParB-like and HNH nuclease domain
MKATEAKLLEFLKRSPQFVIPIYQRIYSWTERECQQLWDEIMRAGQRSDVLAQSWDRSSMCRLGSIRSPANHRF